MDGKDFVTGKAPHESKGRHLGGHHTRRTDELGQAQRPRWAQLASDPTVEHSGKMEDSGKCVSRVILECWFQAARMVSRRAGSKGFSGGDAYLINQGPPRQGVLPQDEGTDGRQGRVHYQTATLGLKGPAGLAPRFEVS